MKKIFFSLAFMFLISSVNAQDKESFWGLAIGLRPQIIQDELVSRSRYGGSPFYFMINHIVEKPGKLRFFQFEGSIGSIRTKEFKSGDSPSRYIQPRVSSFWNEITYSHLYEIQINENSKWWIGPSISNLINVRNSPRWDNSSINYDASGNLQAEGRYQRSFELLGKQMKVVLGLKVPLIGYITRPIYAGVPDFLDQESGFESQLFENTSVSWLGNFPHIQFDSYLELPIAAKNRIQILYNWEYYSYQKPSKVQVGAHVIGVNFLMKTR